MYATELMLSRWIIRWLLEMQLNGSSASIPGRLLSAISPSMQARLRALAREGGIYGLIDTQLAKIDPKNYEV